MQVRIIFNVKGTPSDAQTIKGEFLESCQSRGQDMTEAFNAFMREYIKKTGQAAANSRPRE